MSTATLSRWIMTSGLVWAVTYLYSLARLTRSETAAL
jgi:hypothetical protein